MDKIGLQGLFLPIDVSGEAIIFRTENHICTFDLTNEHKIKERNEDIFMSSFILR